MSQPAVRVATLADVPALVKLINAAYRVEEFFISGDRTTPGDIRARLETPGAMFLVIDGAAGELAAAILVEIRVERGYFGMLSVDPARQKEGLGRRLVEDAEARCRAAGCRVMDLVVVSLRSELPPYYERLGYRTSGTEPFHSPEKLKLPAHLVLMTKPL